MLLTFILIGASLLLLTSGYFLGRWHVNHLLERSKQSAKEIIEQAKREAEQLKQEQSITLQKQFEARREELDQRVKKREQHLERLEARVIAREEKLERKSEELTKLERKIVEDARRLSELISNGELLLDEERKRLEALAQLSREQVQELLMRRVEEEAERFFAKKIRQIKERTEQEAEMQARKIITTAIQRYAADIVEDCTTSWVSLPNDDYKGRIIGKEGRNIKAFEVLTGVEVLVDDTPDTVVLSCFHPIRREVARLAMEKLIEDGRIHPVQIKKHVEKSKQEVEEIIKRKGREAVAEVGLDGVPIHPELVTLLGRLYFRTSYGQNQLQHSKEVAFIAGALATELGADSKMAKRAGLLHDIGKAVDALVDKPHSLISADLARRYGEPEEIVHAIAAHNEEVEPQSILAVLLQAADALSAARPGARQETFEAYIQRLQDLERICHSFTGVEEAYAVQAGREVRVMVKPDEIDDDMAAKLSYDIARMIEEELKYPGEIKVNVIRSTEFMQSAK